MPNRFYLSTRKDRSAQAIRLLETLKAQGWECTFDWTHQSNIGPDRYADTALAEIAAVREADVLLSTAARRLWTIWHNASTELLVSQGSPQVPARDGSERAPCLTEMLDAMIFSVERSLWRVRALHCGEEHQDRGGP